MLTVLGDEGHKKKADTQSEVSGWTKLLFGEVHNRDER